MHAKPQKAEGNRPRRWFQFRLTTWFVLVAILAWAMLQWPYTGPWRKVPYPEWVRQARMMSEAERHGGIGIAGEDWMVRDYRPPSALLYPALALAAFVGWKAAWAVGRRVAARDANNTT